MDKRTGFGLLAGLAVTLILRFVIMGGDSTAAVVSPADSIAQAEKRLQRVRQVAATVPGKEAVLKQETALLETAEKGVFKTETESQAHAQLLEMVNNVAKANGVQTRGQDEYRSKPVSADYGEITVGVSFSCDVVQLVNFLAGLAGQDLILATNGIHITGGTDKKKMLQVRISVSGLVPRKLLAPEKKGLAGF
ncbi:MAG TPA: type II secretion system protein GspM [Candidatus Sulfopaludibacter sp.]|nr:type II secretion system protein GspM [Candidatus Sulfopaludibacter sp.]